MISAAVRSAAAAIAAAVVLMGGTPAAQAPPAKPLQAILHSLERVEELQAAFRKDDGQTRIVLLLSPT